VQPGSSSTRWRFFYQIVVKAYPRDFRSQFEQPALEYFDDMIRDAAHEGRVVSGVAISAIADTTLCVISQRFSQIRRFFIGSDPKTANRRHVFLVLLAVLVLGIGGYILANPVKQLLIDKDVRDKAAKESLSTNSDFAATTAAFVNTYVESKYYGGTDPNVGYDSPYAQQDETQQDFVHHEDGSQAVPTSVQSLKQAIQKAYHSTVPGFDPLICSKVAPTKVEYDSIYRDSPTTVSQYAAFSYADSDRKNIVRYDLRLDQSETRDGDWKISAVYCLSAETEDLANRPFILDNEAFFKGVAKRMGDVNNHSFVP
jgi:hypothetical protein